MDTKLRNVFLGIFVVLVIITGGLYFSYRKLSEESQPPDAVPAARADSETVVTHSKEYPGQKVYLKTAILNNLLVENAIRETASLSGEERPVLNLETTLFYNGKNTRFTIPVVDKITVYRYQNYDFIEEGRVDVNDLEIEGKLVNIRFVYVPDESPSELSEITTYCETYNHELCLQYLGMGFGNNPLNFDLHLNGILAGNNPVNDSLRAFPDALYLVD